MLALYDDCEVHHKSLHNFKCSGNNHWTSLWSMQKHRLKHHHWGLCEVILKEVTSTHRLWRQTTKPIFLREKNYLMSWYLQKLSHYYLRRNWFYFSTKLLFNPIPVPRNDSQNKVWNRRGQQTCSGESAYRLNRSS
jgi:hypothetical protein